MRKSNFALRLQPSLLEEARKLAEAEGVALNQLINVAVAEKLSALRTESYFAERASRANIPEALRILDRAGVGQPPVLRDGRCRGLLRMRNFLMLSKAYPHPEEHPEGASQRTQGRSAGLHLDSCPVSAFFRLHPVGFLPPLASLAQIYDTSGPCFGDR